MKILALSTWFPYPPDNGSKMRTYHLLSHLGSNHELDLITLSQSAKDADHIGEVRKFCRRVSAFPEPHFHPEERATWLGFLSLSPRYFLAHHSPEMDKLAARWTSEEKYDAVIAITLGAAPYAARLDTPFRVLDQHNVESYVIKRQSENEHSPIRRLRYTPTWLKTRRFERGLTERFDAITVVSDNEQMLMRQVLGNGHGDRVHVIPNGVDPKLLDFKPPQKERRLITFTGSLSYKPNFDAAMRLCRDILPSVARDIPDIRLRITGKLDGLDIGDLSNAPGIEFTGYVDDIKPLVASASALVVPLKFGGGTRLKILEAMALGTPVISTPMGVEGLGTEDGRNILLGDTDEELARQTVLALSNPELSASIAENAMELIKDRYLWPDIASDFERVVTRVMSGTRMIDG